MSTQPASTPPAQASPDKANNPRLTALVQMMKKLYYATVRALKRFLPELKRACMDKPIELLGLVVSFLTFVVAAFTLIFLIIQLNGVRDNLESQAYSYIINSQVEFDKIFIENSKYRSYFQNGEPLPTDSSEIMKIWTLADAKLDIMDAFHSQAEHINWLRYSRPAWEEFHKRAFRRSRVLCQAICNDWPEYGKHIRIIASQECDKKNLKLRDLTRDLQVCEWIP